MIRKMQILGPLKIIAVSAVVLAAIGFAENKQMDKTCREVVIDIDSYFDNYFVDKDEVLSLMTEGGNRNLLGAWWKDINLKQIEKDLLTHGYIKKADVYKDLEGRLLVDVYQKRPIARITPNQGAHGYVSSDGEVIPVSDNFTSRVMLVGGDKAEELIQTGLRNDKFGEELFTLITFIDKDPFWRAQIAGMNIDHGGEITLYPQVTKQTISFGQPEDIDQKFKKLDTYYHEILPQKGWNYYSKVNLKYRNQIVCE